MAKWKELGEVPNSDDDENLLDSDDEHEAQLLLPSASLTEIYAGKPSNPRDLDNATIPSQEGEGLKDDAATNDVWDIPSSSLNREVGEESGRPATPVSTSWNLDSSPLSSPPSDVDDIALVDAGSTGRVRVQPGPDEDGLKRGIARPTSNGQTDEGGPKENNTLERTDRNEHITPKLLNETTARQSVNRSSSPPVLSGGSDGEKTPQASNQRPPANGVRASLVRELSPDAELARRLAQEGNTLARRSFRPRKPIQEHPYLLESAHFTNFFKNHGLRPIKVAFNDGEAARRKQHEDSQEQEYEEDTQSTTRSGPRNGADESQESRIELPSDDRDELALSSPPVRSSSPPKPIQKPPEPSRDAYDDFGDFGEDDDDLPALDRLFAKTQGRGNQISKRKASPKASSKQKHTRVPPPDSTARAASSSSFDVFNIPPSPPRTTSGFSSSTTAPVVAKPRTQTLFTPKPSSASGSTHPTPAVLNRPRKPIDLTMEDDSGSDSKLTDHEQSCASEGHELLDEDVDNNTDASSSDHDDAVARVGRRIRGVLPASWLRLDKQISRPRPTPTPYSQHSPEPSLDQAPRKGVAQRKHTSAKATTSTPFLFDDDSDEEVTILRSNDKPVQHDSRMTPDFSIFDDDPGSDMEDNQIDRMLPQRKRHSSDHLGPPGKRRKSQKTFQGQVGARKRQPKITSHLSRSRSGTSVNTSEIKSHVGQKSRAESTKRLGKKTVQPPNPPRLSILDVVEPTAPPFLRIAARTARNRPGKGVSSPRSKQINLATRRDNVDALSVLRNWKSGRIPARAPAANSVRASRSDVQHLQSLSNNHSARPRPQSKAHIGSLSATRLSTHNSDSQPTLDNFVTNEGLPMVRGPVGERERLDSRFRKAPQRPRNPGVLYQAAQLETTVRSSQNRNTFHAQKKFLDRLYRDKCKNLPSATSVCVDESVIGGNSSDIAVPPAAPRVPKAPSTMGQGPKKNRLRFRKRVAPRNVDITAPQYTHANDPLPDDMVSDPVIEPEITQVSSLNIKLGSLRPFGAKYTQHFEVFPLDLGVFFHESTIIGDGRLAKALSDDQTGSLDQPRGHSVFNLGDRPLRWGPWDGQVSSEIGVLFDWILDQLQPNSETQMGSVTSLQVIDFAIKYLQTYLFFPETDSGRFFVARILEVFRGLPARIDTVLIDALCSNSRLLVEVLTRFCMIIVQTIRISKKLCLPEQFELEETLKKLAILTIKCLLQIGLVDVRKLYDDLQSGSVRERGIRNENFSVIAWVVLIRILQNLALPRGGLWDLVASVLVSTTDISSTTNATEMEMTWLDFFTLLPLGEFDNMGVVVPGIRHRSPLEGWTLPQRLVSRVFDIYKANPRQPPSFNEYCRALVSRCHFLVEQWGWRKCNGIVGTIFDFFACHSLSHLRNEEVYKSSGFLEELTGTPSLVIQPDDRCFHIFLKLLAVALKRLRKFGLLKEIRNLIARVLPNHDRQYLKEQDIHERDLAALRNHHDLLCTLFWCAPRDLRPSVQKVEKLVTPGGSHKEACLINLRAWNQLARFVVSSGEDRSAFKPFMDWQNNIFKAVLDQYNSAEVDVQQQFLRLTKDSSRNVSQEMIRRVVSMNRQAATDVLYSLLKANIDVMSHAQSLDTASSVINIYQLQEVFTRFSLSLQEFDWSTLRAAVDNMDQFLTRVQNFLQEQVLLPDSQNSWHSEDAILLLDRHLSTNFFSMARKLVLDTPATSTAPTVMNNTKIQSQEQVLGVAGRLASVFMRSDLARVSNFLASSKYGIFEGPPVKIPLHIRRFFYLFIAVLVEQDYANFKSISATPLELMLSAIVNPVQVLGYEARLALALKRWGEPRLKDLIIGHGSNFDYNSNRDLFEQIITAMRKALRLTSSSERQQLQSQFSKALGAAMEQMQSDLKVLATDANKHNDYIAFVRVIISLIKANDICAVNPFFYQISAEYSPSQQDPRMQTASILSYGLKLEDGDSRAAQGLFYFLYNNLKLAVANEKLSEEAKILREGVHNKHIMKFMIGRMIPAFIDAAAQEPVTWLPLRMYVEAIQVLLSHPLHGGILREDMDDLITIINSAAASVGRMHRLSGETFQIGHLAGLLQAMRLINILSPSLIACLSTDRPSAKEKALTSAIDTITIFAFKAEQYLVQVLPLIPPGSSINYLHIDPALLCRGAPDSSSSLLPRPNEPPPSSSALGSQPNDYIYSFTRHIVADMHKTWTTHASSAQFLTISIKGPARPPGKSTQSGMGTTERVPSERILARMLLGELRSWNDVWFAESVVDCRDVDEDFDERCELGQTRVMGVRCDGLLF